MDITKSFTFPPLTAFVLKKLHLVGKEIIGRPLGKASSSPILSASLPRTLNTFPALPEIFLDLSAGKDIFFGTWKEFLEKYSLTLATNFLPFSMKTKFLADRDIALSIVFSLDCLTSDIVLTTTTSLLEQFLPR
jgi:hypothetical protein